MKIRRGLLVFETLAMGWTESRGGQTSEGPQRLVSIDVIKKRRLSQNASFLRTHGLRWDQTKGSLAFPFRCESQRITHALAVCGLHKDWPSRASWSTMVYIQWSTRRRIIAHEYKQHKQAKETMETSKRKYSRKTISVITCIQACCWLNYVNKVAEDLQVSCWPLQIWLATYNCSRSAAGGAVVQDGWC